jgi:hypothetical protein
MWHTQLSVGWLATDRCVVLQVVTFPCGQWLSVETQLRVQLAPGQVSGLTR